MNWRLQCLTYPGETRSWFEVKLEEYGQVLLSIDTESPDAVAHAMAAWWLEHGAARLRTAATRHREGGQ